MSERTAKGTSVARKAKVRVWKGRFWTLPFMHSKEPRLLVSTAWLDEAGCLNDIAYRDQPEDSKDARVCEVTIRELPRRGAKR